MMSHQPLLSVIVACYNLETYVDKCVSSIVGQTYSNLEILLIDDGSSDETGIRCDAWQEKDKRIRVIHKQNEGLSYVRKTGVEHATAEYITFVDVDDWIDTNMYANMMLALLSTNSDIVQCGYCNAYEDGRIVHHEPEDKIDSFEIVGRNEGVLLILEDKKWRSYLWNKIFKKCLFDHVVFQKHLNLGEDFISHDLFHHASQSVYLHGEYYFYFQRKGSILNPDTIQKEVIFHFQWTFARYHRYLFVAQYSQYHQMLQPLKNQVMCEGVVCIRHMTVYPQYFSDESYRQQVQRLRSIPLSLRDAIPFVYKLDLLVLKLFPCCFKPYRFLYEKLLLICKR